MYVVYMYVCMFLAILSIAVTVHPFSPAPSSNLPVTEVDPQQQS